MSISNYGQLKQALYRLFHRADIDEWIQDSVDVNTAELAAALNVWETQGTIEIGEAQRESYDRSYYNLLLGTGIAQIISVQSVYLYDIPGKYGPKLREQHRRSIKVDWENYPQGNNKYLETWAQDEYDAGIWLNVEPAEDTKFWVIYNAYPTALNVDADSNALLANWPNVYYWSVARDVAIGVQDQEMYELCDRRYTETFGAAQTAANRYVMDGPVSIEGASTWL